MKILNPLHQRATRRDQPKAEAGEAYAMFNMGLNMERLGNLTEAKQWYWKAADAGDADAPANLLHLLHKEGVDVQKVMEKAGEDLIAALRPLCGM
jgi:TPR repeat protein